MFRVTQLVIDWFIPIFLFFAFRMASVDGPQDPTRVYEDFETRIGE